MTTTKNTSLNSEHCFIRSSTVIFCRLSEMFTIHFQFQPLTPLGQCSGHFFFCVCCHFRFFVCKSHSDNKIFGLQQLTCHTTLHKVNPIFFFASHTQSEICFVVQPPTMYGTCPFCLFLYLRITLHTSLLHINLHMHFLSYWTLV